MSLLDKLQLETEKSPIWLRTFAVSLCSLLILLFSLLLFEVFTVNVWKLVPNEAFAVAEVRDIGSLRWEVEEKSSFQPLRKIIGIRKSLDQYDGIDTLQSLFPSLTPLLYQNTSWLSAHQVSQASIGFVFYIPIDQQPKLMSQLQQHFTFKISHRTYKSHKIQIWYIDHETSLSFFIYRKFLIISPHGILIDDVVRQIESPLLNESFWQNDSKVHSINTEGKAIHISWNHSQLSKLAQSIQMQKSQTQSLINWLVSISQKSHLSLSINDDNITGTGHFVSSDWAEEAFTENPTLNSSELLDWLPAQTAYLLRFNSVNALPIQENSPSKEKLEQQWDVSDFRSCLGGEVTFACANYQAGHFQHQWLLAKVKERDQLNQLLTELREKSGAKLDTNANWQAFPYHQIGHIPLPQFPSTIFGNVLGRLLESTNGFSFMQLGDYWVLANSAEALDALLKAKATQNLLANSIKPIDFQNYAEHSNITILGQPTYLQNATIEQFTNVWQSFIWRERSQFNQWKYVIFSLNGGNNKIRFLLSPQTENRSASADSIPKGQIAPFEIELPVALKSQPFLCQSEGDSNAYVFFQDRWKRGNLLNLQGEILWKKPLNGWINSKPILTKWDDETSQGILFSTASRVYMYNELGNQVAGFPIFPITKPLKQLSFFHNNGQPRLALASDFGSIALYNQYKKARVGWQPKRLDGTLATAVQQTQLGEELFYVLAEQKGILHIFDQFGREEAGFPVSLGETAEDFQVIMGDSASVSYVKLLTTKGNLMTINFLGEVNSTISLPRTQVDATFNICRNKAISQDNRWLISREEGKEVSIFTANGARLLNHSSKTDSPKNIQYFHFSQSTSLIAILDSKKETCHLYRTDGSLLSELPINTHTPISIYQTEKEKQYFIVYGIGKSLKMEELAF